MSRYLHSFFFIDHTHKSLFISETGIGLCLTFDKFIYLYTLSCYSHSHPSRNQTQGGITHQPFPHPPVDIIDPRPPSCKSPEKLREQPGAGAPGRRSTARRKETNSLPPRPPGPSLCFVHFLPRSPSLRDVDQVDVSGTRTSFPSSFFPLLRLLISISLLWPFLPEAWWWYDGDNEEGGRGLVGGLLPGVSTAYLLELPQEIRQRGEFGEGNGGGEPQGEGRTGRHRRRRRGEARGIPRRRRRRRPRRCRQSPGGGPHGLAARAQKGPLRAAGAGGRGRQDPERGPPPAAGLRRGLVPEGLAGGEEAEAGERGRGGEHAEDRRPGDEQEGPGD